jgi:hypothetical protein
MIDPIRIADGYRLYMVEAENCAYPQMFVGKDLPVEDFSIPTVIEFYVKQHGWRAYTLPDGTQYFGSPSVGLPVSRPKLIDLIWEWLDKEYDFDLFEDYSSLMYEPGA